jgi:multidrug efflux system membrane fusion protein
MRKGFNWGIVVALLVCVGGLWYWFSHGVDKNAQKGPPPVAVRTEPVEKRDVPLEIREVGNVVAYETVTVRSRIDSQIMEIKFHDGDAVKQGDELFILDDRTLKSQAEQFQANLERDRAQLENARRQYDRLAKLAKQGFETKSGLDAARTTFESQRATVNATQAALDSVRVQLGYTRITAPIDGRTGTINVTTGNTVKANDTTVLVSINRISPIRVQTSLSQIYFDRLRQAMNGGTVTAIAERDGAKVAEGTVEYIDNAIDTSTGTFAIRARFENLDEKLWPGMFVTLTMRLGDEKDAIIVPEVAIQHGQQGDYVFVIDGDKAVKREVKIARLQGTSAVITDGVKEGEQVAVDGLMALKDGASVNAQANPPAPKPEAAPEKKEEDKVESNVFSPAPTAPAETSAPAPAEDAAKKP